ncbi:hypothetical protein JOM49_008201 [Amycolatopsis magusensis]|uniref:Uncharacterized protein n=1 Tax=Amycolatopsis magusensis TaxID=882444 RepID=A0ABS4Q4S3_9PSEU|nr:hypothetical protein [Amycolatopsis magusensis]MBP2186675.1 hypothetical protein [Amycolatopsis magusensis]
MPSSRWPSMCAVKSWCARSASGPARVTATATQPPVHHSSRCTGHRISLRHNRFAAAK